MRDEIIKISRLNRSFGHRKALRNINLSIKAGEFVSLLGCNGAGKSTLISILSALLKPSSGKVYIKGRDVQNDSNGLRSSVGLVSHKGFLYPYLTVTENLRFYGRLFGVSRLKVRTEELLEEVGLYNKRNDAVFTLSRGMLQRLSIARAVIHTPEILILDEPFSGLDQKYIGTITALLQGFNTKGGTVIMTTHDLDRGVKLGGRFIVLYSGRVVLDRVKGLDDDIKSEISSLLHGRQCEVS